jgi:hypothetical protein
MSLQSFTRKYDDNSTETGFQFTFYCDRSVDSYKTKFTPSVVGKKAGLSRMIGRGISLGTSFARIPFTYKSPEQQASDRQEAELMDEFSKRYDMMSPQWHAEHDHAFEEAQNEAKANFNQCTSCNMWVCKYCWNGERRICVQCSGPEAQKHLYDENSTFNSVSIFATRPNRENVIPESNGQRENNKVICAQCNQTTTAGKFCNNCGSRLEFSCSKCGVKCTAGTHFCGECGTKIG